VIEKVFVNVNPQSTLLRPGARGGHFRRGGCRPARGRIHRAAGEAGRGGQGHAAKEQVQEMVKRLLRLPGAPGPDAADALACAICHAHSRYGEGHAVGAEKAVLAKLAALGGSGAVRVKRGRLV